MILPKLLPKAFLLFASFSGALSVVDSQAPDTVNSKVHRIDRVIHRDVSIIGGGSAGTYAAVGLQDRGKSVLVIEKAGRLGGNTETYLDPLSKQTLDYGVRVWHKFLEVYNYFARLNVSLISMSFDVPARLKTNYIDFNTGTLNTTYTPPDPNSAFGAYVAQVSKYTYLSNGFNLPSPVPEDLYMHFGDFAKKYNLESAVSSIWRQTQGIGNILEVPTIYVFKYIGDTYLEALAQGFVTTASGDNSELYNSAARVLDNNVLYNSTIIHMNRDAPGGVHVAVRTPTETVLVISKKIVFAIQPFLPRLDAFDLSDKEERLFGQFKANDYFTGVLKNTGISANTATVNIDQTQLYDIPASPNAFDIEPVQLSNLQVVTYLNTARDMTEQEIRQQILDQVNGLDGRGQSFAPEFVVSSIHTPFELTVSSKAIKEGFYTQLYSLQGERNTWYASATFQAHDSSLIWRFTENLLSDIAA